MIIYEEILREFQKQKVKYVLVGGIAVNLHGTLRNTVDLDILVKMSDANLARIVTILKKHGYSVKQPVDPIGIADKKIREGWIKNKHMKAFNFYKEDGLKEVDIIIKSPISYEQAKKSAVCITAGSLRLFVMDIDGLIKMKKRTGRYIDKLDMRELKIIKKLKKKK